MSTLLALVDRVIGIPYNAPRLDSFAQGRSTARALVELVASTALILAVAAALLALRWRLGLS